MDYFGLVLIMSFPSHPSPTSNSMQVAGCLCFLNLEKFVLLGKKKSFWKTASLSSSYESLSFEEIEVSSSEGKVAGMQVFQRELERT